MAEQRQPEAWESSATAPFLMVGNAGVTALGGERFVVTAPGVEQEISGFGEARARARELAARDA
jgi:hypothetical protein